MELEEALAQLEQCTAKLGLVRGEELAGAIATRSNAVEQVVSALKQAARPVLPDLGERLRQCAAQGDAAVLSLTLDREVLRVERQRLHLEAHLLKRLALPAPASSTTVNCSG